MQRSSTFARARRRRAARMLELEGVSKSYRTPGEVVVAVHDASLTVEPGELVAVMGPTARARARCCS